MGRACELSKKNRMCMVCMMTARGGAGRPQGFPSHISTQTAPTIQRSGPPRPCVVMDRSPKLGRDKPCPYYADERLGWQKTPKPVIKDELRLRRNVYGAIVPMV